ncbi:FAD-binding and (Fe-S)-binding domain-containing protein [Subtercola lobariae]|uniref:Lactate dehydrogenase n=1 Tax=Subtercola lobariae TaxID=1588641 RepID=A0A917EX78_9MICO|nr:FAD-binding and (Fe-S)-binding domain-containing protein [Subtercola lobariae]GGF18282.1 lactate dehydrogenase [Subtercola lobariae]
MTISEPQVAVISTQLLLDALRSRVRGEVSDSALRRAEYATDASNYRVLPTVVVYPLDADDLVAITAVARDQGIPLTLRGGGTSVAGNSIGDGIVVDVSVHMNRVISIDPVARTARVQPGTVMSTLQEAAKPYGLRLGPDPSTSTRASIGGMIGNNACGPHAVAYGKMSDNVVELDVVDGAGRRYVARDDLTVVPGLERFVSEHLALIRTEFGQFGRQVSGYSLEHLLPENGRQLAKALVGTEGTLVTILEATVALVPIPPNPSLVVLGYPTMVAAADDVPRLLLHHPQAMEGMDAGLVEVVRRARGSAAVPDLPDGQGWLMIEMADVDANEAIAASERLVADASTDSYRILPAGPDASRLWRLRADGAGLGGRTPSGRQAWPGWEDAAVPPSALGAYLREFQQLMSAQGLDGMIYGHFGDGCVHVRVDLPLEERPNSLRVFATEAAKLVTSHGGSLSGEHGDGRARSELLDLMYSADALIAMRQLKGLFDPTNLLNPGIIVEPAPLDAQLRRPRALPILKAGGFAFTEDDGDFTKAVHRCTGVGKCRADNGGSGGFMCPSFQATKDETHVTRGRSRVLQELAAGGFGRKSWAADEVEEALDLCLSCKACAADCPAGVDMAKYKSETLHRKYRGKLRPVNHYVLGWLPRWSRLASIAPRIINIVTGIPGIDKLVLWAGGMDTRRSIPQFADVPFRRRRQLHRDESSGDRGRPRVVLWVDSFTDGFSPDAAEAAIAVLEDAGYQVLVPQSDACCGLTWISTGQLAGAKRKLLGLLDTFSPFVEQGIPIIGLEPSCTAVIRSDLLDLLPEDPRSERLAENTRTLAEILTEATNRVEDPWVLPNLAGTVAVVQPHCHQYAVTGFAADEALLKRSGVEINQLAGCCGLAGNFGMERGHYETSVSVAELELLPALREAAEGTIFLADGFSCRTQADQLAKVAGLTLAQVLMNGIESNAASVSTNHK